MTMTPDRFASLTLEQAAQLVASGEAGAVDLAAAAGQRLDEFESGVNALVTRNPAALADAAARDAAPEKGGRLHGLPLAVKDNIMTRGLRSTCGSRILDNFVPPYNATAVDRILAAGAVVVGKANMDEFAMGSTGENSAYGPTRNPWDWTRVTGGSSSGSAAVVAYGGALAALGSDTGGSIRQPCAFCGLVGMKPTYGRVSRYGLGALASSLDQIGPITRTVRDNALVMDVLSGHDRRDSTSAPRADSARPCLADIEAGIRGLRVGYDPAVLDREGMDPAQAQGLRDAVARARDAGAEIVETSIPLIDYGVAAYYIINFCEASANLSRYDGIRYGVRRGDGDLWATYAATRGQGLGDEVKRRIMMGAYALSKGYYDAYYLKAARVRGLFTREFGKLFESIDALVMPVVPQPPRAIGAGTTLLETYLGDIFTLPANLTSLPALAFPVGVAGGLPVGVQALGAPFAEDVLYRLARAVEQRTDLPGAPWTRTLAEAVK